MTETADEPNSLIASAAGNVARVDESARGSAGSKYAAEPTNGPAGGSGASDSSNTGQTGD